MSTSAPSGPSRLDLVHSYRHRTKHRYKADASGSPDWDVHPTPFQHFAGTATEEPT